jgi:DNA-binding transcriptional ArsR family regulator
MTDSPADERLLLLFKSLADANRLKIVGLLARQPYPVEQLVAILNRVLPPSRTTSSCFPKLAWSLPAPRATTTSTGWSREF